jgi:hypothetical protein
VYLGLSKLNLNNLHFHRLNLKNALEMLEKHKKHENGITIWDEPIIKIELLKAKSKMK